MIKWLMRKIFKAQVIAVVEPGDMIIFKLDDGVYIESLDRVQASIGNVLKPFNVSAMIVHNMTIVGVVRDQPKRLKTM